VTAKTPKEEKAAYDLAWKRMDYQRNPEKYKARAKAWRDANLERARAKSRDYQRRNAEAARARYNEWIAKPENRAKVNATLSARLREHPQLRQKYEAVRRARKRGALVEVVDRRIVLERAGGLCGWCSEPIDPTTFHVDHIVALVHGGEHSYANTQPVHPACNYEKRTVLKERAA
jgi:hypothetical protein